ncbi:hypothetical protein [Streptomyces sp. DSM 40907]|uniref:hypothetical protein n=1 Tax=Streptomyces kutzneri TaxID=3051179 RepID=UPI0028D00F91|nr:hypothetical protein [Streptomyces sp. DSM 40907]
MHLVSLPALFTVAFLASVDFGAASRGSLETDIAPALRPDRSATLAAYYVHGYAAMSLPTLGANVLTQLYGMRTTALLRVGLVALPATTALLTLLAMRRRTAARTADPAPPKDRAADTPRKA